MTPITPKDLHWFQQANAATYPAKQHFYKFKDSFLHHHATPDGHDLQYVHKTCWTCDGSGYFGPPNNWCKDCGGTGIFSTREVYLERWDLRGHIYHIPTNLADSVPYKNEIDGLIKHPGVSPAAGFRSFMRLLLRHQPTVFWTYATGILLRPTKSNRWLWRAIRIRNEMDLFPAIPLSTTPVRPLRPLRPLSPIFP